jgi:hypothetical protein
MGNGCLTVDLAFWQWLAGMGIVAEPTEMAGNQWLARAEPTEMGK